MIKEWLKTYWREISIYLSRFGNFDFTILPLLKNPLFVIGIFFIAFVLLMLRLFRILAIYIGVLVFLFAWSFLIAPYGSPGDVPFVNWWFLIGIGILVVAIEFYLCLVVLE